MSEEIKGVFIKQMLLPKEELALQTMELMADKMELEKQVEQLENIRKEIKKEIKKYAYTDNFGDTVVLAKYIEDILNKGSEE